MSYLMYTLAPIRSTENHPTFGSSLHQRADHHTILFTSNGVLSTWSARILPLALVSTLIYGHGEYVNGEMAPFLPLPRTRR